MAQVFCVSCGVRNPEHAEYCFSCGKRLVRASSENAPATDHSNTAGTVSSQSLPDTTSPPPISSGARLPPIEIRPKSFRNGILLILIGSVFTILGVFLLIWGETKNMTAGLFAIAFFGGGGLLAIPKLMRRKISFVLTGEGLEQIAPIGRAYITWSDVEKIGVVSMPGTALSVSG